MVNYGIHFGDKETYRAIMLRLVGVVSRARAKGAREIMWSESSSQVRHASLERTSRHVTFHQVSLETLRPSIDLSTSQHFGTDSGGFEAAKRRIVHRPVRSRIAYLTG